MKRILIIILGITTANLFFSCQKTVTLDLKTAASQIVIQGEVTNLAGPYTITVNQTTGFYADNNFPPISGASIKISDNLGVTDSLTETSPGVYSTHILQGMPGNTYTLSVLAQNQQYSAVSTMPAPITLDSISFQHLNGFGDERINAIAYFQDPAGVKNNYQFMEYINGQQFNRNIFVFDDRLSDGRYINRTLFMDSTYLKVGDQLEVKMYCIDDSVYNYFFQLDQSTYGNTASPANPTTNISNGAYGYFSAHTVDSKKVTVY
jgi:hypothetical protein